MLLTLALLVLSASGRQETYCVGGYTGTPGAIIETACNLPAIAAQHTRWHHHNFFIKDGVCYDCWDEHDTSCQISFARKNPSYHTVRAPQCGQQDNAGELIEHVIVGMPAEDIAWDLSGPVDAGVALGPADHPPTADEPTPLVGTATDQGGITVPAKGHFELTGEDGRTTRVPGTRQEDGTVTAAPVLPAGTVSVRFVPELPIQPPEVRDRGLALDVRPQLSLPTLQAIDFGTVPAGSPHTDACQILDLSGAVLPDGVSWAVSVAALGGCVAQPVLPQEDAVRVLGAAPVTVPLSAGGLTVCLQAPWCDSDSAGADTALRLVPADPRYPDVVAEVPLRWSVTGRSWVACNGFWLWPALGSIALLWAIAGFVRPSRFPPDATVKMAGSAKGLKRAVPTRLLDAPGSGAGFYRDARLGLLAEGSLNRDVRRAVVVLRATRDGVRVAPKATVERQDRRSRSWVPAELEGGSIVAGPRDVFRVGDLYFQLEVD